MSSTARHGPSGLAISNHVVKLLSDYTGRGPTKAQTHLSDDPVTVVVENLLTKGERSLVRDGRAELVLDMRRAYQQTMADDLTGAVEDLLDRRVVAFLSANHIDPDLAVKTFVLAPEDGSTPRSWHWDLGPRTERRPA